MKNRKKWAQMISTRYHVVAAAQTASVDRARRAALTGKSESTMASTSSRHGVVTAPGATIDTTRAPPRVESRTARATCAAKKSKVALAENRGYEEYGMSLRRR